MSKNIVAFLIYILLILACTTEVSQQVALPPSDPDIWKKAFDGEDIYVITQGTVAVPLIKLMEEEIPGARWKARFDYDPDISSNYIVIDFQSEKSGTPLDPVIGEMFSGMPVSGTLQVESNRIRMGYFSDDVYTGMTDRLKSNLKSYAELLSKSRIEKTRGPWYADPLISYLEDERDRDTGESYLTAVNYFTGEKKRLIRYEVASRWGATDVPWTIKVRDLCGSIEWISGLISADQRPGENLTGFYGAFSGGAMDFSGTSLRTYSYREPRLGQADIEFSNDLMQTWVEDRSLRQALPDDYPVTEILQRGENEFLVRGRDFSGNPFDLFELILDRRENRTYIRTFRKIRTLELPLVFNGSEGRVYSFTNLRTSFTQEIESPFPNPRSVSIEETEGHEGFVDLHEGLFFSLTEPDTDITAEESGENKLFIRSNHLPFGNLESVSRLISFYPELEVLSLDSDLITSEDGKTEYLLIIETSPMEKGVTYQVSIQGHPALFSNSYLWEFTVP